jgi:hypothetical protein
MSDNSEKLPDFQYDLVRVRPSEAIQTYLALREEGKGVFSPVILDSPDDYYPGNDGITALRQEISKTLEKSLSISAEDFFARKKAELMNMFAENGEEFEEGGWPAQPFKIEPYLPGQMEGVYIVKVPTPHSYEAPAYIGFGGWNDCPTDEEHVAVLKYWHDRYGAELFAQGRDMLECIVERPPTTREEALALAWEQLSYAFGSLGEFGIGQTPQDLAAALLNSRHWIFWWD